MGALNKEINKYNILNKNTKFIIILNYYFNFYYFLVHQMSSIEEPLQEPSHPPPNYQQSQQKTGAANVNVVEVENSGEQQQQGDSDTLTGHKQLVFRRNSAQLEKLDDKINNKRLEK